MLCYIISYSTFFCFELSLVTVAGLIDILSLVLLNFRLIHFSHHISYKFHRLQFHKCIAHQHLSLPYIHVFAHSQLPYANLTACQLLGNLCVLTLYNPSQSSSFAPDACALYNSLLLTTGSAQFGW